MSALPRKHSAPGTGRLALWLGLARVVLPLLAIATLALWLLWPRLFPPQPQIRTSVLVEEIRAAAKLATVEMHATVVANRDESAWYGSKFLFLVVPGRAAVGFDLERLTAESVAVAGQHVTVTLPPPEVLYVDVALDQVETYNAVGLFRAQFTPEESRALLATAQAKIRAKAEQEMVFRRAEEQARDLVRRLVLGAGAAEVTVEFGS